MPKMIASKPITYDMKTYAAGDEFEVDEQYAGTLVSLGRATVKDTSTKVGATTTKSKDEAPAKEETAEEGGSRYKTRRLKSDE